ncbi:DUF971 domain-containing protein [Pseudoduganella namucuonensis]|uniref:DUF971 family protein n=1 Tax=Pseudoduganella namucuonensis TaxID=1035707 RepID=A0A1I7KVN9_9BURK|nr:DUF971 domain-containing protein [Pseudoduganella namucuonensis]SFV01477.1 DUF971 family protein [Pseudoduganella namucuonensis]
MSIQGISNDRAAGTLELALEGGETRRLSHAGLRARCHCADCKALRRRGEELQVDNSIRLIDIVPVGAYGVQLVFSDGHDRGIYPWRLLESLEPSIPETPIP